MHNAGSTLDRMWKSKPETFLLNREKLAVMISKQKTGHYSKSFTVTIPVSKSKKGVRLTLKVFPFGRNGDTGSRHASIIIDVSYPLTTRKCRELVENCSCIVEVKLTFINAESRDQLCTKEGKAELNPTSCEACIQIRQALPHEDIFYSKTKYIQLQVEAGLRCRDKLVLVSSTDPQCPDYLVVKPS